MYYYNYCNRQYCQDLRHALENSGMGPAQWVGRDTRWSPWYKARAQLVGWLTGYCGLRIIGDSVGVKSETDGDSASSAVGSEWRWKWTIGFCDILVDFQTAPRLPHMADQCCIPSWDSTGCFIRVHGNPPPVQWLSPIQLASNHQQTSKGWLRWLRSFQSWNNLNHF